MHLYGTAKLMVLQYQLMEASSQASLLPILLIQVFAGNAYCPSTSQCILSQMIGCQVECLR